MNLRVSAGPHFVSRESTQTLMLDVIIALVPTTAAGIYLFGVHTALMLAVSVISAVLSEFVWQKLAKKPVRVSDLSAVVTGLILGLNMPPEAPLWLPAVGSLIAIVLVKQLFGGIGLGRVGIVAGQWILLALRRSRRLRGGRCRRCGRRRLRERRRGGHAQQDGDDEGKRLGPHGISGCALRLGVRPIGVDRVPHHAQERRCDAVHAFTAASASWPD